ncbi:MAG: hypothetical protein WD270_06560, partial [Acetobacterales bacterium]
MAPLDARSGTVRLPGAGLVAEGPMSAGMTCFAVLVLATVGFDGIGETPLWSHIHGAAMEVLYRAGVVAQLGYVAAGALVETAGLLLAPPLFMAVFLMFCRLSLAAAGDSTMTAWSCARRFAPTLLPIAIAYHLAHYAWFLLIEGQRMVSLVSDPFGFGWNLFGTAGYAPDLELVGARWIWLGCIVAVVAGHVVAILLAHVVALRAFADRCAALRSQGPMVAL